MDDRAEAKRRTKYCASYEQDQRSEPTIGSIDICAQEVQPGMRSKPEGAVVFVELIRRLDGLSLESCKDVGEYTRKCQEIDFKLKSLHSDVALLEPYLICRYL